MIVISYDVFTRYCKSQIRGRMTPLYSYIGRPPYTGSHQSKECLKRILTTYKIYVGGDIIFMIQLKIACKY